MAVARDDSVVRGSLIATLILLVLSLALNFFLYRWGDQQSLSEDSKSEQLSKANQSIVQMSGQLETLKKILGVEPMSDAEFESLANSDSGDADIDVLVEQLDRSDAEGSGSDQLARSGRLGRAEDEIRQSADRDPWRGRCGCDGRYRFWCNLGAISL